MGAVPPSQGALAADSNRNYIRHTVLTDTSGTQGIETVKYYDGLGRHVETVALGAGADGAYHYNICDYLGNVRTVVKSDGTLCERNDYYPFGMLHDPSAANADVQPHKYGGKELDRQNGLDLYDSQARWYDPILARTTTMDQLAEATPDISPYAWCAANPVRNIDFDGRDTVNINYVEDKWQVSKPRIAEGDDVFIVNDGKSTQSYTFSDGEYGKRVCALNLEIGESKRGYTLGVYHISGSAENGTGYFVTPGGEPSLVPGSNARIPEGDYPILTPSGNPEWYQPQVGGDASARGIKFHCASGLIIANGWTLGCFVISSNYYLENGDVRYKFSESLSALQNFDSLLGGGVIYKYKSKSGRSLYGSNFSQPINKTFHLKSR